MSKRKKIDLPQLVLVLIVLFFLVLTLFPIYVMLVKSVKSPSQEVMNPFGVSFPFRWKNYGEAWGYIDYTLANTFLITVSITVLVLLISSMASFGFTRFSMPGKNVLFMMFLAILMIPGVLTLIPQYKLVALDYNLINSRWGVILPTVAGALPMSIFLIKTFFEGMPVDVFEAAKLDGASSFRLYLSISLPLSLPILATQGLMTFMSAYNDYLWPLLILRSESVKTTAIVLKDLTTTLFNETNSMSVAIAGYALACLPMFLIFAFCSKQFVKGMTSGAFKM